jgi:hypothetical protein
MDRDFKSKNAPVRSLTSAVDVLHLFALEAVRDHRAFVRHLPFPPWRLMGHRDLEHAGAALVHFANIHPGRPSPNASKAASVGGLFHIRPI